MSDCLHRYTTEKRLVLLPAIARISAWVSAHHNKPGRNFKSLYNPKIPNTNPNPNPNPNLEQKVTVVLPDKNGNYRYSADLILTDSSLSTSG